MTLSHDVPLTPKYPMIERVNTYLYRSSGPGQIGHFNLSLFNHTKFLQLHHQHSEILNIDFSFQNTKFERTISVLFVSTPVSVHSEHVVGDLAVAVGLHLIQDDEQQIETGQERVLKANVLHRGLVLVILKQKGNIQHVISILLFTNC